MECEIATEWTVDEKTLRDIEEDGAIDSKVIQTTIPDVQYFISILPHMFKNVYLILYVKSKTRIDAEFSFSIDSAKKVITCLQVFSGGLHGNDVFCYQICIRDEFFDPANRYFLNGKLILQLRGTLKCDNVNESVETISQIFWKKEDKDFTIEVDDKEITAHKFILRERSPYFAAMFDSGMKESIENKVKFEVFPFNIVEAAIKICYDCENKNDFSYDEYLLLLKFSDVYDISVAKVYAERELVKSLDSNNVCRFANASVEFNANNLRFGCMNFLVKCSKNSIFVADFDSLDDDFKLEFASKVLFHKI